MSPVDWRQLPLVPEDESRAPTTFGEAMQRVHRLAAGGQETDAFDEALDLAMVLHAGGLELEALELLEELVSSINRDRVATDRWPWLYNVEGISLAGVGRNREALEALDEMRRLAEALPAGNVRDELVSTALQNLGIVKLDDAHADEAIDLLRESLRMKVALKDYVSAVDVLNSLALAVADTGDIDKATRILADVEELSRTLREPRRVGAAIANRAGLHLQRGDLSAAEADYRAALRYARREGDPLRELLGMLNVGSILSDQGQLGQAMRWYRRGARWAREHGAAMPELRLRRALALALVRTGRQREAVDELQRASQVARELGAEQLEAECLADLGAVEAELGNNQRARGLLEDAVSRFARLDDDEWRARALRNLAEVRAEEDGAQAAEALWHEASELLADEPEERAETQHRAAEHWLREPGHEVDAERWLRGELVSARRFEEGALLAWRTATAGALLTTHRPTEGAVELLSDALAMYDDIGDDRLASRVRIERAVVLSDLGRQEEVATDLRWCLEVGERLEDRALQQHARANLGEAARRREDLEAAERELSESLRLARELGDEEAVAHALGNLGLTLSQRERFADAAAAYTEQLAIARRLRDPGLQAVALGGLAMLDFNDGRYGRAVSRYRQAAELQAGLSSLGEVEDLGGWLESLAAAGRFDELQPTAQRLVDAAQTGWRELPAATAIARAARHLLAADESEGASLYGTAIRLRLTEALREDDFAAGAAQVLAETLGLMTAHVETDLPEDKRAHFYEQVLADLDRAQETLGDDIRPYLEMVRSELERMGIFEELRRDSGLPPDGLVS